jgi:hypothetical protein
MPVITAESDSRLNIVIASDSMACNTHQRRASAVCELSRLVSVQSGYRACGVQES